MGHKPIDIERLKKIIRQLAGKVRAQDGDLITPAVIKGKGYIWCYSPQERNFKRIPRGTKAYIINEARDNENRLLIYTESGEVVRIEQEELLIIGLN
jgi:hypothetical protein